MNSPSGNPRPLGRGGCQDLQSDGVSSKRENAEFVGERIAATVDGVAYVPLTLDIDPPKRGGQRPNDWEAAIERTADRIEARS